MLSWHNPVFGPPFLFDDTATYADLLVHGGFARGKKHARELIANKSVRVSEDIIYWKDWPVLEADEADKWPFELGIFAIMVGKTGKMKTFIWIGHVHV